VNFEFNFDPKPLEHRSGLPDDMEELDSPSWNPPSWNRMYPQRKYQSTIASSSISKRVLAECVEDDEDEGCEDVHNKPFVPHMKPYPQQAYRLPMPYPIFMESRDEDSGEYSPFDHLPPMHHSSINPGEETWVKTWDKNKNGLPEIADSNEAAGRIKNGRRRTKH
jgi:hypothetical protein